MDFSDFDYRYSKTKVQNLTVEEFNQKLDELDELGYEFTKRDYKQFMREMRRCSGNTGSKVYFYTEDKCKYHLYYQVVNPKTFKNKTLHYCTDIYLEDKVEDEKMFIGRTAIQALKKYCEKYNEDIEFPGNKYYDRPDFKCRVFLPTNPKIVRNRWIEHCYGYDMHSCYPSFINNPLPYGDIIRENDIVHENEIGFRFEMSCECTYFIMCLENEYADVIFKSKYYKGMIEWANDQYKLKKKGQNNKKLFNAMLGNMKHHNIFIRVAVLEYAYRYMENLYNQETTILSTIDSLVSLVPRTDLNIGDEMGQFALEHEDEPFIFSSNGKKQWLTGEVIWKGKAKSKIRGNGYLLRGLYYLDYENYRFRKTDGPLSLCSIWPEYEGEYNGKKK